jgi:hypothetical protein
MKSWDMLETSEDALGLVNMKVQQQAHGGSASPLQ